MFSPLTASVPFIQHTDGNRIQMDLSHHRQSQFLGYNGECRAEIPLIRTQMSDSFESRFFIKRALNKGLIRLVDSKIIIEYDNGGFDLIEIYPQFDVKVVDKQNVAQNQILMIHKGYKDSIFRYGTHLNTLYGELKDTFEDSILLSESGANKLTSFHVDSIDYILTKKTFDINSHLLNNKLVKKGDWLIKEYKKPGDLLASPANIILSEVNCEVVDVNIQVFETKVHISNKTREFIEANNVETEIEKLSEYISKDNKSKLQASLIMHDNEATAIVRITYKYNKHLEAGDKLVNRYGNKGVVSNIISDEEARDRFKFADKYPHYQPELFLNPLGIHSRMNPSQLGEQAMLYVQKYIIPKYIKLMLNKNMSYIQILQFIVQNVHMKIDESYANKITAQLNELSENQLKIILVDILNSGLQVEFPVLGDNLLLKVYNIVRTLAPDYFKHLDTRHGGIGFGVEYILKLEHMVSKKINSTSTGVYSFKGVALNGQRVGEMEFHALMAYGANASIYSFQNPKADEFKSKNISYETITDKGEVSIYDLPDADPTSKRLVSNLLKIINVDIENAD